MKTGIIIKPSAWLYDRQKTAFVDEAFMGWAVGILKEEEDWLWVVTHYGYRGYLKKDAIAPYSREALLNRERNEKTLCIGRAFADIMEHADLHSEILCTLGKGSFVSELCEAENGYQKIRMADGREGYVSGAACKNRKDSDRYLYEDDAKGFFLRQIERSGLNERVFRRNAVLAAKSYLGTQYRWAGKSAAGIDCSGLTFMCYLMNGILIYRDAQIRKEYPVHEISIDRMQPADLLYFPDHVAMYIGDGMYIHATGNAGSFCCMINSLLKDDFNYRKDLAEHILAVGSVWEAQ